MNKKITIPLVLILVLGLGFMAAAWVFGYDKTIEGQVVKTGGKLEVIVDLSNFSLNTSSGANTSLQDLTLDSKKDNRTVEFFVDVNKSLGEPMCPDFENDCNVWFGYINGTPIFNGTDFIFTSTRTVVKGLNYYQMNTTCQAFSCEQNLSVRIALVDFP